MSRVLRLILTVLATIVAPPAGFLLLGRPVLAGLWCVVPMSLVVARVGPGLGLLPAGPHDLVVWASLVMWVVGIVVVGVLASRRDDAPAPWGLAIGLGVVYLIVVRIVLFGVTGLVERYAVRSAGMLPGLAPGDVVLATRGVFRGPVSVGDIVTIDVVGPDGSTSVWIRRVVAVGGQSITLQDGVPVLDGVPVPTAPAGSVTVPPFGQHDAPVTLDLVTEELGGSRVRVHRGSRAMARSMPLVVVPEDHVFVLGDHRSGSLDSRRMGPVPLDQVRGRMIGAVWTLW